MKIVLLVLATLFGVMHIIAHHTKMMSSGMATFGVVLAVGIIIVAVADIVTSKSI